VRVFAKNSEFIVSFFHFSVSESKSQDCHRTVTCTSIYTYTHLFLCSFMYLYHCIYIYISLSICVYIDINTHIYTHKSQTFKQILVIGITLPPTKHNNMYLRIYIHIYIYVYSCIYINVSIYIYLDLCIRIFQYIRTHVHTHKSHKQTFKQIHLCHRDYIYPKNT